MRTTAGRARLTSIVGLAIVAGLGLGSLTACETVAPPTSDQTASALITVVGKPADQAKKLLMASGYRVVVVNGKGDPVAATAVRLVTGQRPVGGTKLARGRTVTITLGG